MAFKRNTLGWALVLVLLLPAAASADGLVFSSTSSAGSFWWYSPTNSTWGFLGGVVTGSVSLNGGPAVDLAGGCDPNASNCWTTWGTGPATLINGSIVNFGTSGSFLSINGGPAYDLLLQGTFTSATLDLSTGVFQASFTGQATGTALSLVGLSGDGPVNVAGTFVLQLNGVINPAGGWMDDNGVSYAITTDDLNGQTHPAPEPGTMALLGSGLLGLVAVRRRSAAT